MSTFPTSPAQTRVHIRWMIRRDMPEVLAIEHASFEYPWCEEEFLRVLRQRNCIGMVAEYGERIVGFMIYELHRNKIHVLDFATHPEFRRRGVGRQMIAEARRASSPPSGGTGSPCTSARPTSPRSCSIASTGSGPPRSSASTILDTGEDAYLCSTTWTNP